MYFAALSSVLLTGFTRFTVAFQPVGIGECGFNYDDHRNETKKPHKRHEDVGGGKVRPGFHEVVMTVFIIARAAPAVKGGLPYLRVRPLIHPSPGHMRDILVSQVSVLTHQTHPFRFLDHFSFCWGECFFPWKGFFSPEAELDFFLRVSSLSTLVLFEVDTAIRVASFISLPIIFWLIFSRVSRPTSLPSQEGG